jgi:hypothetical protein
VSNPNHRPADGRDNPRPLGRGAGWRLVLIVPALCLLTACATQPKEAAVRSAEHRAVWPRTTVAERPFDGDTIFIERDGERMRAWVLPSDDDRSGEALEFFSGDREKIARVIADERGEPRGFVAANGRTHLADPAFRAYDATDPVSNQGARYFGDRSHFVDFAAEPIAIADAGGSCELELRSIRVQRQRGDAGRQPDRVREKLLMYLDTSRPECRGGRWESSILSAMDLGDGTALLTMPAYAVRVRMSDFAPAGKISALKIMDGARIRAMLRELRQDEGVVDPNGMLTTRLGRTGTGRPARQR